LTVSQKLLLADDSVTIQRVIELTFAEENVQVLTAGDGEQAIARVQADRPDIVLADIGMPKRSGYDVAAFIKGQPDLAHIPVLLLTGAFEPVDEGRARAAGCDGVLVKPFEPQHVIARVRELLRDAAGRPTGLAAGTAALAVADVPRPAERLAPHAVDAGARTDAPALAVDASLGGADSDFDFALPPEDRGRDADSSLDDYFDRLDAAFASMSTTSDRHPGGEGDVPPGREPEPEVRTRPEGPVMEDELDIFDAPRPAAIPARHVDVSPALAPALGALPVAPQATFATPPVAPQVTFSTPPPVPFEETPATSAPTEPIQAQAARPVARVGGPTAIAEAFAALLAVEQGEPGAVPVQFDPSPAPPQITPEMLDEITRRVLERLSTDAVKDVVSAIVSDVAERLVREEIQRIRSRQ
jgi:CheY-like chemotaxis protein